MASNPLSQDEMRGFLAISVLLPVLALCGCGGQWTDDPNNWKRAFDGSPPPADVTIVHSFYRRTSSLSREQDWSFELKLPPSRRKLMFENLNLRHPGEGDTSAVDMLTKKEVQPSWFLSKPATNYETWISTNTPGAYVGAFEDKQSGSIFLVGLEF
jgi:hypothetical protein